MELCELPAGWKWTELARVAKIRAEQILPSKHPSQFFNYLALENIEQGSGKVVSFAPTRGNSIKSNKFKFTNRHVLYGKLRPYLRKAIAPDFEGISATDLLPLLPEDNILNRHYLVWWLLSPQILEYVVAKQAGVKMPRLRSKDLAQMPLPLPSLPEQKRIVAKIESLFVQSRLARQALERVPVLMAQFRRAVLASAFRGELVEQDPSDEPAVLLLEHVRAEHRRKWEEGLRAKGRDPARYTYHEPELPDTSELPELPEGWVWTTLPLLGELARGKSKHRPRNEKRLYSGPYPFIQTGDIARANGIVTRYSQTYSELGLAQSRLWPKGTLCITIAANIADTAILGFDSCFPDSVVGFIANEVACDVCFVEYYMRTVKDRLEQFAPATAQKNINLNTLQHLAVSLPPLAEQRRIVTKIEALFALAGIIEQAASASLRRAEQVDQSILARAFRGELE